MPGSFEVLGRCLHVSVPKFQDKFTSLRQVNSPICWEKLSLYRHVFDKISTEFRGILRVFCEFRGSATARNINELRHLHYTNWWLKICIWRLYFSSWSPKGDLRIFLILSPVVASIHNSGVSPRQELTVYEMTFNEICLPSSHMYKFNEYLVTKILCTLLDTRRALDTRKWDMKTTFYVTSKTLWQMWTDA